MILGLVLILVISIILWFSSPKGCPGANGGYSCGYYGSTDDCAPIQTFLSSLNMKYSGKFASSFSNRFPAEEIILEDIEVIYEGDCYNEEKRGSRCIIEQPEMGSNIPKGEILQLVAQCPSPKKDATHTFVYFIIKYKAIKDGEEITETSECGVCLIDNGDGFSA